MKEEDKNHRKQQEEIEISNLRDKELKVMAIRMPTEHRKMDEHSENFNTDAKT